MRKKSLLLHFFGRFPALGTSRMVSRAWCRLRASAVSSDWLIVFSGFIVIGSLCWLCFRFEGPGKRGHIGCFPLCQRFRKFRLEFKWKSPFRFLQTGIFGINSGGGPLISVGIFRPKFVVPFLTNWFFAFIRKFGRETNSGKSHYYWLAWFNRKMSFHFARKFPLISDRSVWHND